MPLPTPRWSGTALIDRELKLAGIGSLMVGDVLDDGSGTARNRGWA